MIQFDCVTLFPQMFAAVADFGIARRARVEREAEARVIGQRLGARCLPIAPGGVAGFGAAEAFEHGR